MSERNGDRARFRINRARKILQRQRIKELLIRLRNRKGAAPAAEVAPPTART
jgi:hypothetical protein